jgi:hypothetical protein
VLGLATGKRDLGGPDETAIVLGKRIGQEERTGKGEKTGLVYRFFFSRVLFPSRFLIRLYFGVLFPS